MYLGIDGRIQVTAFEISISNSARRRQNTSKNDKNNLTPVRSEVQISQNKRSEEQLFNKSQKCGERLKMYKSCNDSPRPFPFINFYNSR